MPQQNVIQNPSSQQTQAGPDLNDRDKANDILATEKYLTDSFNIFLKETSHRELYEDVKQILFETHDCAREAFNLMFKKGHYKLEGAEMQQLQQAQQQFQNYRAQFPYGNAQH